MEEITEVVEVIEAVDFEENVLRRPGCTVAIFTADWSGPCRMLMPILKETLLERSGIPKVVRVDIDEARELAVKLQISGLPTLMGFRDGVKTESLSGTFSKGDLHRLLDLLMEA